jgi:hypothetical protein
LGALGEGKDKGEYRDLSTAAAKCAAFGRDDVLCCVEFGSVCRLCRVLVSVERFARGSSLDKEDVCVVSQKGSVEASKGRWIIWMVLIDG